MATFYISLSPHVTSRWIRTQFIRDGQFEKCSTKIICVRDSFLKYELLHAPVCIKEK